MTFQTANRSTRRGIRRDTWFALGWHGQETRYTTWEIGPVSLTRRSTPRYCLTSDPNLPDAVWVEPTTGWTFKIEHGSTP